MSNNELQNKTHDTKYYIKEYLIDTIVFIIGSMFFSVGVNCFTYKNHILNGGFTGLSTIINYLTGLPIGLIMFVINIPFFIISYKKLGQRFIMRTTLAAFILSLIIDLGNSLPVYQNDLLLSAIFGGALCGAGLGIIFLRNATTGGTDIIAKLLQVWFPQVPMGKTIFLFDLVIIIAGGLIYHNVESMLYAGIVIFLSSNTIDYILYGMNRGIVITVITDKAPEIRELIIKEFHRGVTIIKAQGGYTDTEKNVIVCACYDNQAGKIEKKIKEVDEHAFFIVTQAKQIMGQGFYKEQ